VEGERERGKRGYMRRRRKKGKGGKEGRGRRVFVPVVKIH